MKMNKKITKRYLIKLVQNENSIIVTRTNHGFSVLELLGILSISQQDIIKSLAENESKKINQVERSSRNSPYIYEDEHEDNTQ